MVVAEDILVGSAGKAAQRGGAVLLGQGASPCGLVSLVVPTHSLCGIGEQPGRAVAVFGRRKARLSAVELRPKAVLELARFWGGRTIVRGDTTPDRTGGAERETKRRTRIKSRRQKLSRWNACELPGGVLPPVPLPSSICRYGRGSRRERADRTPKWERDSENWNNLFYTTEALRRSRTQPTISSSRNCRGPFGGFPSRRRNRPPEGVHAAEYEEFRSLNHQDSLGQVLPRLAGSDGPDGIVALDRLKEEGCMYTAVDKERSYIACGGRPLARRNRSQKLHEGKPASLILFMVTALLTSACSFCAATDLTEPAATR